MKLSEELQKAICEEFSSTKTGELAKKYNIAVSSIYNIINKHKIIRPKKHKNRKYDLNEEYFEKIDSEHKAYFLGFMYADGNVNPDNTTITLRLQERDKYILDKFSEKIGSNRPIRLNKLSNPKWQNSSDLSLSSRKLFDDIIKKGCLVNKTLILKFPTINVVPENLQRHFIRGYFDGDGCISGKKLVTFSVISTLDFLVELQKILVENCNLSYNKISPKHKTNNIVSNLRYSGTHYCERIREYMYKDATIFLTRKKEKFDSIEAKRKENKNQIN